MYKVILAGGKYTNPTNDSHVISAVYFELYMSMVESSIVEPVDAVWYDEPIPAGYKSHDEYLYKACEKYRPDMVMYSFTPGWLNPSSDVILMIRKRLRIPVAVAQWDTNTRDGDHWNRIIAKPCDIDIAMDSPYLHYDYMFYTVSPATSHLFYDDNRKRDIDVSFLGDKDRLVRGTTPRKNMIEALEAEGIEIFTAGDHDRIKLSNEEYANLFRRSKITLNFPMLEDDWPDSYQRKGRILEATRCGALVAEEKHPPIDYYFTPGRDYIELIKEDPKESVRILKYYLEHEDERKAIAERGKLECQTTHSPNAFWHSVLRRLNIA